MIPADTFVGALTAMQAVAVLRAATAGPALPRESDCLIDGSFDGFELRANSLAWSPDEAVAARQVRVAAGAALLNMRVAVRALGVSAVVELLPDAVHPDVLGAVHTQSLHRAGAGDLALGRAQSAARVTPRLWLGLSPEPVRIALRRAARTEGAWLATIGPRQQGGFENLAGTVTPPHQLVAVVGTLDDGPLAQLRAGLGVQRALLTARNLGLHTHPQSHLVDEPTARQLLRQLLGGALWPQMVIGVNYGESELDPGW